MKIISQQQVHENLTFAELIPLLKQSFSRPFTMPQRQVFSLNESTQRDKEKSKSHDAFALLPSWNDEVIGNKAFTYFPDNAVKHNLPGLFSKIMLFKRQTGEPLALVDGTSVTYWRTAAISALACQLLSRQQAKHLFLFGTGNLAAYIIAAHLSVRKLEQITIWGRNAAKVQQLIKKCSKQFPKVHFHTSLDVNQEIPHADIIVCATGAKAPLFSGKLLKAGSHVDCLGNHLVDARECDSETITRANVYVDSLTNTLSEAGELLIPIAEGVFNKQNIIGELADMCKNPAILRQNEQEITLFKSVGTAISDLVAAYWVYQKLAEQE